MRLSSFLIASILFLLTPFLGKAQEIQGQVVEVESGLPLANVAINNHHRKINVNTEDDGKFSLTASNDELVEFKKEGYKVYRIRIPVGTQLPFFKIGLEKIPGAIKDIRNAKPENYRDDSLKYYSLYEKELNFHKLSTFEMLKHPFSAMSKTNRQIWAFQDEFSWFQKEKYINYTFNEAIVYQLTGLKNDSAKAYMRMFRPTYDQLSSMSEYAFYGYIKRTVEIYRKRGIRGRIQPSRSSN